MARPLVVFACAFCAAVVARSLPAQAGPQYSIVATPLRGGEAPVDEYFGRYQLSSLSIRTAISDMTIEGNSPLALPLQVERIQAVRSALPQWAQAYPRDPWVPSTTYRFAQFLIGKRIGSFDAAALGYLSYLVWAYPRTPYARQAQDAIDSLDMVPAFDLLSGPAVLELPNVSQASLHLLSVRHRR